MELTWWTQPNQLDAEQKKVVALLPTGNHLVVGPPGSGKTNLLILRATYLYNLKVRNTVVITFGRVLREFLVSGNENYPFAEAKLQTYVKWAAGILAEHGVVLEEGGDFPELRRRIFVALNELRERDAIEDKYDCILIDEAQDYSAEEMDLMLCFGKQVFAVGDDKQRIYEKKGAIDYLRSKCQVTTLRYHYRNGIKICRVADGIRDLVDKPDGLEANAQYDEAQYQSSVRTFSNLSIPEQVAQAVGEIETQLRAYPEGTIGVFCPRHSELDEVWLLLERSPIAPFIQIQRQMDGYTAFDRERRVVVTTLHSAKGLEFRAVHLLGMDKVSKFRDAQKRMSYTGVTRAKTSLAIYHEAGLPGHFERGLAAIEPDVEPPTLDELFNG